MPDPIQLTSVGNPESVTITKESYDLALDVLNGVQALKDHAHMTDDGIAVTIREVKRLAEEILAFTAEPVLTFEVYHVVEQVVKVHRDAMGNVVTTCEAPRWASENPFSAPEGEIYDADTESWRTLGEVRTAIDETFGDDRNGPPITPGQASGLGLEVACGDTSIPMED